MAEILGPLPPPKNTYFIKIVFIVLLFLFLSLIGFVLSRSDYVKAKIGKKISPKSSPTTGEKAKPIFYYQPLSKASNRLFIEGKIEAVELNNQIIKLVEWNSNERFAVQVDEKVKIYRLNHQASSQKGMLNRQEISVSEIKIGDAISINKIDEKSNVEHLSPLYILYINPRNE